MCYALKNIQISKGFKIANVQRTWKHWGIYSLDCRSRTDFITIDWVTTYPNQSVAMNILVRLCSRQSIFFIVNFKEKKECVTNNFKCFSLRIKSHTKQPELITHLYDFKAEPFFPDNIERVCIWMFVSFYNVINKM